MNTSSIILAAMSGVIAALVILLLARWQRHTARPVTVIGWLGIGLGLALLAAAMPTGNALACLPGAFFICACAAYARRARVGG